MKALITTAEIVLALRTHFGIDEGVDITFTGVQGLDGICALVDQAPILGTNQVKDSEAATGETEAVKPKQTRTRRTKPAVTEEVSEDTESEGQEEEEAVAEKPKRTFGKKKVEEPADDADDNEDEQEQEVEEAPATTKRRFGKAKVQETTEEDDSNDDDDSAGEEEEEVQPVTKKRTFGKKAATPVVEEDDEGEDGEAEEEEVAQPKATGFKRKTVFGKKVNE